MSDALKSSARVLRQGPLLAADAGELVDIDARRLVPHRPPMLLIDRIDRVDCGRGCLRATRRVLAQDPVFDGHFPGQPVYPGVLLVEMMAQAALAALPFVRYASVTLPSDYTPPAARFTRVRDAVFLAPVVPGDTLHVLAEASDDGLLVSARGQVFRGDILCAYAVSEAYLDA